MRRRSPTKCCVLNVQSRAANGLNDKGKATWVHIVYAIREALELLDFDDESILVSAWSPGRIAWRASLLMMQGL